mmetsp:Transcript_4142/g.11729  ORF Transcript_4142/g.11729 Transcript_4142/m.11729 type:complete len:225 (+) Transcript_4142:141-815(+)
MYTEVCGSSPAASCTSCAGSLTLASLPRRLCTTRCAVAAAKTASWPRSCPRDTGLPSSRELRGRRKRPQRAAQRRRQPTRSRPRPRLRRRVTPSTARGCSKPSLGRGGATSLRRGPHAAALPGAEHHPHRAPPLVDDGLLVLVATAAHGEGHLHPPVHREHDRAVHQARAIAQHLHDHRAVAAQPPMIAGTGEVAFHRLAEVQPVRHRLFAPHALPLLAVQLCL